MSKDLVEYILETLESRGEPIFQGFERFYELWDLELLIPNISILRLEYSHDGFDECYLVLDREKVSGLELDCHSGQKGEHLVSKLLNSEISWSIQHYNTQKLYRANLL
ncbi:MAG: hypothetical protein ACOCXG_03620 [Nanoarchaeota archaeon]